jgi:hypothetical protein
MTLQQNLCAPLALMPPCARTCDALVLSRQVVQEVMQLLKEGQPVPEHLLPPPKPEEKKGKGGKDDGKGKKAK